MNILHVSSSISRFAGGVAPYVLEIAEYQQELFCKVSIGSRLDIHTFEDIPIDMEYELFAEPASKYGLPGGARSLNRRLTSLMPTIEIVHSHALWESCLWSAASIARKNKRPYLVSPHGMLEPWSLRRSRFKKALVRLAFVNRYLSKASCLHATAPQEADNIRKAGLNNPIAVIPIGLDVNDYCCQCDRELVNAEWPQLAGKKVMLFMSRVHPKKGLFNIAEVWGDLAGKYSDWHLVIAGPDENGHEAEVREAIDRAGVRDQTTFTGPVYGELKKQLYAASDFFVLPTFSENFGIVIAEALASGKPVITTKGTPWKELQAHNCGWWIDIGSEPLEAAMTEAMNLTDLQRLCMGMRGRKLIEENYSWPTIASQMIDVYKWVLGQGGKPDCVRFD